MKGVITLTFVQMTIAYTLANTLRQVILASRLGL